MEQGAVLHSLHHVVQLDGLIFAARDDEPLAGRHRRDGLGVGVVREVCGGRPLLQRGAIKFN